MGLGKARLGYKSSGATLPPPLAPPPPPPCMRIPDACVSPLLLQSHYDGDPSGHGFAEPRPSPYADGLFRVQIKLERDYPITPPKVCPHHPAPTHHLLSSLTMGMCAPSCH